MELKPCSVKQGPGFDSTIEHREVHASIEGCQSGLRLGVYGLEVMDWRFRVKGSGLRVKGFRVLGVYGLRRKGSGAVLLLLGTDMLIVVI